MLALPKWLRVALLATALMNILGAVAFLPGIRFGRDLMGLPADPHPFYLLGLAVFILLFGLWYGWCGLTGHAPRMFLALAATGKLSFFFIMVALWLTGSLPAAAPLNTGGDLIFGGLFAFWVYQTRRAVNNS
jgi:hypothetical protein